MRPHLLFSASLAAAALLAGCGGGGGGTATTATTGTAAFDPASSVTWERSYSDCGSVALTDLANRYHAKRSKETVSIAVGLYWAKQAHGGSSAAEAGRQGCLEGFKAAGR